MSQAVRRYATFAIGALFVAGVLTLPSSATTPTQTVIVNESFTGTTTDSPDWALLGGSNVACLTNGAADATPVPACDGSPGTAGLQLTPSEQDAEGGVVWANSVPTTTAIDMTFDSSQFGSPAEPADGITFFFAASQPQDAIPAASVASAQADETSGLSIGAAGGSLGYAPAEGFDGLTNAYLGVGLDVYGNFAATGADGSGCDSAPGFSPEHVTVRGPGNGSTGYCAITSAPATLNDESGDQQDVPVEVAINPTDDPVTTPSNASVPAHSFLVELTSVSGTPVSFTGALPDASGFFDPSWIDGNGVPKDLTFGWTAATGEGTDVHIVSTANAVSLSPPAPSPTLGLSLIDDADGTMHNGQTVTYRATASVTNADENHPITIADTFPTGLTPQPPSGTGWDCSTSSGQTVNCTYADPVAADASTPPLDMPVAIDFPAGTSTHNVSNSATASSDDASPSSAEGIDVIQWLAPTATSLQFITQPIDAEVNSPMTNADDTLRHVQVGAYDAGGTLDPNYGGPVTLSFANNPGGAHFVDGGSPASTLTTTAVDGVADFAPVIVDTADFGYTLEAADDSGLSPTTSNPFNIAAAATVCPAGETCNTDTSSDTTGETALIQAGSGDNDTVITATYGGSVFPLFGCLGTQAPAILTFTGDRQKTITLTIPAEFVKHKPIVTFCYGQPTPFVGRAHRMVRQFNPNNNDYEGVLAFCGTFPPNQRSGPCVVSVSWRKGQPEVAVIRSATDDPHLAH